MSVRRLSPLGQPAQQWARELKRCEARVALLDRARPLNWAAELARLSAAFLAGRRPEPAFEPGPPAQLAEARSWLRETARALEAGSAEERLLSARALELELEAELAEHVGRPAFAELARRRFPLPLDPEAARSLAEALLASPTSDVGDEPLHVSDDPRDPNSLWSKLSQRLEGERWPVRIELTPGLVSLAAVADGVVRVRPGARLSARVAERIALHEVEGHVRPRVSGQVLGGAFLAGTRRASEDEEGRAILLEERAGLFDSARRKELARRYLAAASVRQGATLWETFDLLGRTGALALAAMELACRVHRGGGLGRELIYLTGYARVKLALTARPELEQAMKAGRLSLDAAETLLDGSIELDDDGDMV